MEYDDHVLREVLEQVESIIENSDFDDIDLGSDLNWDPSRKTYFVKNVNNFVERFGLVCLWSEFPLSCTHSHTDGKSCSTIDHFLVTPRLLSLVDKCGIEERGDNLSKHCPIWVKFRLGTLPLRFQTRKWIPRKPCWSKASLECSNTYTGNLQGKLMSKKLPSSLWCSDPHCSDKSHSQERDLLLLSILHEIVNTSYETLPTHGSPWFGGGSKKKKGKSIPGWVVDVEPFRAESVYWRDV